VRYFNTNENGYLKIITFHILLFPIKDNHLLNEIVISYTKRISNNKLIDMMINLAFKLLWTVRIDCELQKISKYHCVYFFKKKL
jgi:hypothetical protein